MFRNGKTAILLLSNVGRVVENAGGMKLFDRAGSAGCNGSHYLMITHPTKILKVAGIEPFANQAREHSLI